MDESELDALLELRAELVQPQVEIQDLLRPKPSPFRWYALAAILLVGVLGGWWWLSAAPPAGVVEAPAWVLAGISEDGTVQPGQSLRPRIYLPDGSRPYVYLLHIGSTGEQSVLVPAPGQSPQRAAAPGDDGWTELAPVEITAEPPFGDERLALVLTRDPVKDPFGELARVRSANGPVEGTVVLRAQFHTTPDGHQD